MKRKILLTSQGLSTDTIKDRFLKLVAKDSRDIVVAYIVTAAYEEPKG